uniref:Uncharacterized protein n=1 Tax=Anguilla anguilla TaxID=7936 RepID=A0A0E9QX70_ANGAN
MHSGPVSKTPHTGTVVT